MSGIDPNNTTLIHFYRAVVGHADVGRQRMDATTNWAAATTVGMITFAFSTPNSPHFVLLVAVVFDTVFLLMESRRYLFAVALLSWGLKLQVHPTPADGLIDALGRADVGLIGAEAVLAAVLLFVVAAVVVGLLAPSERMIHWAEVGSPWGRLANLSWLGRSGPEGEEEERSRRREPGKAGARRSGRGKGGGELHRP